MLKNNIAVILNEVKGLSLSGSKILRSAQNDELDDFRFLTSAS